MDLFLDHWDLIKIRRQHNVIRCIKIPEGFEYILKVMNETYNKNNTHYQLLPQ